MSSPLALLMRPSMLAAIFINDHIKLNGFACLSLSDKAPTMEGIALIKPMPVMVNRLNTREGDRAGCAAGQV